MKVPVYVDDTFMAEISSEDIRLSILEYLDDPQTLQDVLHSLNSIAAYMKAIPDELIDKMTEQQKNLIRDFLDSQATRYSEDNEHG